MSSTITPNIELTTPVSALGLPIDQHESLDTNDAIVNIESEGTEHDALPPTDRGRAAWLVLAGCSVIQAPVWGTQCIA